jgi:hypothetical protein
MLQSLTFPVVPQHRWTADSQSLSK